MYFFPEWDEFTKFRAKSPAGRTDWRAFQLVLILNGGRRRRKFGGPLWKENRAIMLCHCSWVVRSLGALQKRINANLSFSLQERSVLEETFTDHLWRLVRYVQDSLKSAGLLAFTAILLMPDCKSKGWSHSAYKHPTSSKRTPMSAESTWSGEVDRDVIQP